MGLKMFKQFEYKSTWSEKINCNLMEFHLHFDFSWICNTHNQKISKRTRCARQIKIGLKEESQCEYIKSEMPRSFEQNFTPMFVKSILFTFIYHTSISNRWKSNCSCNFSKRTLKKMTVNLLRALIKPS